MLKETADLIQEVHDTKGVIDSTKLLIDAILNKIEASKDDPVAVQAAIDELRAAKTVLADANAANPLPLP